MEGAFYSDGILIVPVCARSWNPLTAGLANQTLHAQWTKGTSVSVSSQYEGHFQSPIGVTCKALRLYWYRTLPLHVDSIIFKLCQVGAHPSRNECLPICENFNQTFSTQLWRKIHISGSAQPITCTKTSPKKNRMLFYYITWIPTCIHKHVSIFTPNNLHFNTNLRQPELVYLSLQVFKINFV